MAYCRALVPFHNSSSPGELLRPLLEQAGLTVSVSQHQAWRGAPLADGTSLAPLNPVLVLRGVKPAAG